MSDIHIARNHRLGIERAREIAQQWLEEAQSDYGLECDYQQGTDADNATFGRPGVDGSVHVTGDSFSLRLTLGFLLEAFGPQIENKVATNIDALLAESDRGEAD